MRSAWPAWLVMWTLAGGVYGACKLADVGRRRRCPTRRRLVAARRLSPGVAGDGRAGLPRVGPPCARPAAREWVRGSWQDGARRGADLRPRSRPRAGGPSLVAGWVGMVGLVFVLHFGAFHLLTCAWRPPGSTPGR